MNGLLLKLAITATAGGLLFSNRLLAQVSPTTKKAASVRITQGPALERTDADFAIVRWTTNNPGGSPVHHGIVRYGIDPRELSQIAKSPIRLKQGDSSTVFRVRVDGLEPRTTYYYTVESMEANGTSDGGKSTAKQFTTPGEPPRGLDARVRVDAGRPRGGRE
jgi:phosphodiesterase/alkaline phosphatase D-like protein